MNRVPGQRAGKWERVQARPDAVRPSEIHNGPLGILTESILIRDVYGP